MSKSLLPSVSPRSAGRAVIAVAIAAVVGLTGSASAQFGQAAGFGEMMSPYFMRRDLMLFAEGLELDEGQAAIVETLYMDYEDEHEQGRERMFDRINDMREDLDEMDRSQLLEIVFQPFEDRSEEWDAMRERFLDNVKAILSTEQLEQWPAFRRQLRRDKELPKGQFGAESLNLFHLVRDLDLEPAERSQLDDLLGQYDYAMDKALLERESHTRNSRLAMMHAIRDDDPSASVELHDRQITARVRIRDTNLQYGRAMAERLSGESGEELRHTVQMRAYPRIYRETPALRIIRSAERLDDISAETLDGILAIERAYVAEIDPINANLERLLAEYEPESARYRANSFAMRATGTQAPKPVDPTREEFKRRQEVGKRYVRQLQGLLTDEQFRSLPGASRYLRTGQAGATPDDAPKKLEERRYGTLNRAPVGREVADARRPSGGRDRAGDHTVTPTSESTTDPAPIASGGGANSSGAWRSGAGAEGATLRERCQALGIGWVDGSPPAEAAAVGLLQADDAVRLRVVPLAIENGRLRVAMMDPLDLAAADEISALTGKPVTRVGLEATAFTDLLREHFGTTAARMAESLASDTDDGAEIEHNLDAIEADDIHRMAEQPTLINLVNLLLLEAIQSRASDVHIEPFESELRVKYRVDGELAEQPPPPKHLQPALIGRIKIMSGMNIAERYVPQDGHITLRFEGRKVDIRVSTVPTLYGESVVMRILDKSALPLELATLGMTEAMRKTMDTLIAKPHGMVLVTGPTGSGKTTTLYAALTKLYDPRKKIITIEDPVEYELTGINQIPVNPKRGLTFAMGLRSILRQDPDVIFVGEIRDTETADIAIRSALTGHLIFSTLHTNDAISSIGRMTDMGVEPYLVASVMEGVLAQRLGRRICPDCAERRPMPEEINARLAPDERELFAGSVWRGAGCSNCNDSGYRGRIGYFELLRITPGLRAAISANAAVTELSKAVDSSFESMRDDGIRKAAEGLTTVEEVMRATQDAEELGV